MQFSTRNSIATLPVISSFMKFCEARTFWVERHLDVVSRSSRWFDQNLFFTKLVDIYDRKTHCKNYDDCFINERDIQLFELLRKNEKKEEQNIEVSKIFNFGNLKI